MNGFVPNEKKNGLQTVEKYGFIAVVKFTCLTEVTILLSFDMIRWLISIVEQEFTL